MKTRLFVVNFAGLCGIIWAASLGYVQFVFAHDISHLSYLISALFVISLAGIFLGKTSHLERVEVWLVTLGLIGNLIGFVLAMHGIDTGALGSAEGVQRVATNLLAGMGVAFCSSLVGAIAAIWISINAWMVGK
jgi:hypothetical protein